MLLTEPLVPIITKESKKMREEVLRWETERGGEMSISQNMMPIIWKNLLKKCGNDITLVGNNAELSVVALWWGLRKNAHCIVPKQTGWENSVVRISPPFSHPPGCVYFSAHVTFFDRGSKAPTVHSFDPRNPVQPPQGPREAEQGCRSCLGGGSQILPRGQAIRPNALHPLSLKELPTNEA